VQLPEWLVTETLIFLDDQHALQQVANGYLFIHQAPDGSCCIGGITTGEGGWTIEQVAPLTLSPSVHCLHCGTHGFVRDGKWVNA
jgi:hypothetical protein